MISRSKTLTDTEKKLQSLKRQLYGNESSSENHKQIRPSTFSFKDSQNISTVTPKGQIKSYEIEYLKTDLLKIFALATVAILSQLLIYSSVNRGLLKF